ncbi:hypothetical protein [Streptomyces niveus]
MIEGGGGLAPDGHAETVKPGLKTIRDGLFPELVDRCKARYVERGLAG